MFNLQGGDVPLMKAIDFNNVECVKLLLRFGANPKLTNNVKYKIIFRVIIARQIQLRIKIKKLQKL